MCICVLCLCVCVCVCVRMLCAFMQVWYNARWNMESGIKESSYTLMQTPLQLRTQVIHDSSQLSEFPLNV